MKKQIIKKSFSLFLILTLALCTFAVLPDEDYNIIIPRSILDDDVEPDD